MTRTLCYLCCVRARAPLFNHLPHCICVRMSPNCRDNNLSYIICHSGDSCALETRISAFFEWAAQLQTELLHSVDQELRCDSGHQRPQGADVNSLAALSRSTSTVWSTQWMLVGVCLHMEHCQDTYLLILLVTITFLSPVPCWLEPMKTSYWALFSAALMEQVRHHERRLNTLWVIEYLNISSVLYCV